MAIPPPMARRRRAAASTVGRRLRRDAADCAHSRQRAPTGVCTMQRGQIGLAATCCTQARSRYPGGWRTASRIPEQDNGAGRHPHIQLNPRRSPVPASRQLLARCGRQRRPARGPLTPPARGSAAARRLEQALDGPVRQRDVPGERLVVPEDAVVVAAAERQEVVLLRRLRAALDRRPASSPCRRPPSPPCRPPSGLQVGSMRVLVSRGRRGAPSRRGRRARRCSAPPPPASSSRARRTPGRCGRSSVSNASATFVDVALPRRAPARCAAGRPRRRRRSPARAPTRSCMPMLAQLLDDPVRRGRRGPSRSSVSIACSSASSGLRYRPSMWTSAPSMSVPISTPGIRW